MDSGWAVPTLNPGLSETVAVKLLIVARGRCGGVPAGRANSAGAAAGVDSADFRLLRNAFCLARDSAGRSSAARTAMTAITTSSSMRVKARR